MGTPTKALSKREARVLESMAAAWQKGKSKCVVAELFSPPRFTTEAERQGLTGLNFELPTWRRVWNRNVAERQAEFCIAQAKRQLRRGGRVLFEHPWSSGVWTHPPMAKKSMHLCKASMCAYGLKNPDNGLPILKPTGLAVSHGDMVGLAQTCPGHDAHHTIALYDSHRATDWKCLIFFSFIFHLGFHL